MFFSVPPSVQAERLKVCNGCKFMEMHFGNRFCGTPVAGKKVFNDDDLDADTSPQGQMVTHYRKKIRLCGCKLTWKTKYKTTSCPAGKWGMYQLTKEEGKELKEYVKTIDGQTTFPFDDLKKMGQWAFKMSGDRQYLSVTQCAQCVVDMITNLKKLAQHI